VNPESRSLQHLLQEARQHVDPDVLAAIDLEDEDEVARLRETVARSQSETAQFKFGYQIEVIIPNYISHFSPSFAKSVSGCSSSSSHHPWSALLRRNLKSLFEQTIFFCNVRRD
jgi:hypothetical protein